MKRFFHDRDVYYKVISKKGLENMKNAQQKMLHTGIFWYWNATPTADGIREQLRQIADAGFECVYLHPMSDKFRQVVFFRGMKCAYLGKKYFEMTKVMLEECRKLGLTMMLYDESGWPSGKVDDDKLVKLHPEHRERVLVRKNGRITEERRNFPDLFSRAAVRTFIEMAYEPYWKELGKEFGKTIRGIFTDEPFWHCDAGHDEIRIFDGLEERLKQKFHCDFRRDVLPWLWKGTGNLPEADLARRRYREAASEIFAENYVQQLADWCAEHHLDFEGHLGGDDTCFLDGRCGDQLDIISRMHVPGVDAIWRQIFPGVRERHHPRLASSAAIRTHRKQALCECFNVYGYSLQPAEMSWVANDLLVQGINRILPMPFLYSDIGVLKAGCSTDISPRVPQWAALKELNRLWKIASDFDAGAMDAPVWVLARTEHPTPDAVPDMFFFPHKKSTKALSKALDLLDKLDSAAIPWRYANAKDLTSGKLPKFLVSPSTLTKEERSQYAKLAPSVTVLEGWNEKLRQCSYLDLKNGETKCRTLVCKRPEGESLMIFNPDGEEREFAFRSKENWGEITLDPVLRQISPLIRRGNEYALLLPPGGLRILLRGKKEVVPSLPAAESIDLKWKFEEAEVLHFPLNKGSYFEKGKNAPRNFSDGGWLSRDFSGIITLESEFFSESKCSGILNFMDIRPAGELFVNGKSMGVRGFAPWAFPVNFRKGINHLKLKLFSSAGSEWRRFMNDPARPPEWSAISFCIRQIERMPITDAETGVAWQAEFLKSR